MTTRPFRLAVALVPVVLVLAASGCRHGDLRFDVTFKDAHGLQAGHAVAGSDGKIGEVVAVTPAPGGGVRVAVRVDGKHRKAVYQEAAFVVEKPGGFFDLGSDRQLRVRDRGDKRTPIAPGAVVAGSEPAVDNVLGKIGELGAKALGAVNAWADRASQFMAQLPNSAEARELRDALTRLGEQARATAADQVETFQQHLPELQARAEEYRRRLEKAGQSAEAKRFAEQFDRWVRETVK